MFGCWPWRIYSCLCSLTPFFDARIHAFHARATYTNPSASSICNTHSNALNHCCDFASKRYPQYNTQAGAQCHVIFTMRRRPSQMSRTEDDTLEIVRNLNPPTQQNPGPQAKLPNLSPPCSKSESPSPNLKTPSLRPKTSAQYMPKAPSAPATCPRPQAPAASNKSQNSTEGRPPKCLWLAPVSKKNISKVGGNSNSYATKTQICNASNVLPKNNLNLIENIVLKHSSSLRTRKRFLCCGRTLTLTS